VARKKKEDEIRGEGEGTTYASRTGRTQLDKRATRIAYRMRTKRRKKSEKDKAAQRGRDRLPLTEKKDLARKRAGRTTVDL